MQEAGAVEEEVEAGVAEQAAPAAEAEPMQFKSSASNLRV